MRRFVLPLFLFAGAAQANVCTLDTDRFVADARALAASKKGSKLDEKSFTVSWRDSLFGDVSVSIGGCAHFGLAATANMESPPMREAAQRLMAAELVTKFWPAAYGRRIAQELRSGAPTREQRGHEILYRFTVNGFDEVVLLVRTKGGRVVLDVAAVLTT